MRSRTGLTGVTSALVLLVASFGLVSCGGDDGSERGGTTAIETETTTTGTTTTETETTPETTTPEPAGPSVVRVTVVEGAPRGGIVRATVEQGDRVALVVTSDVADEVHLHGYDLSRDVPVGGTTRIAFVAKLPGRFEVELEERGAQIAELTVRP